MIRIEQLLREWLGLESASIGPSIIHQAARLRIRALDLKGVEEYVEVLKGSPFERDELMEAVVVNETWFFRDREPFTAMVRLALQMRADKPKRVMRLLSVPCASGEEPYSMAIALLEAGLPSDGFQIDGADVSARALGRAQRGVYRKNSFRGNDLSFRAGYFSSSKEGFALKENIRRLVRFFPANLLDATAWANLEPYDFVFCRNLLIYLDRAAQQSTLDQLEKLLAPSGVLFVGAAEPALVLERGFVSANLPMAFACTKERGSVEAWERQSVGASERESACVCEPSSRSFSPAADAPTFPRSDAPNDLATARQLADAGRLAEASAVCQTHLRQNGASAEAYYLLGLVRDAGGHADAAQYYRKALYLEPNHYETLLQLSLLSEKSGDEKQARALRDRAQRCRVTMTNDE